MEFIEPYSEEIKRRFRSINRIGKGAYGEVWLGYDTHVGERVALKQVRLLGGRKSGIPRAIFREIESLRQLKHQNIVDLISIFPQDTHLMLVFEFLPTDLQVEITKAKDFFPLNMIKYYSFQIFSALSHCHQHHIIHRDLKPSNILISSNGVVKLADFGLARVYDPNSTNSMSHQIATRWYRPPELLFASRHYTESVDIWSAAVIVAELITLTPLFPGNNDIDQIFKVFQIMGTPTSESWPEYLTLPDHGKVVFSEMSPVAFHLIMPCADEHTLSFLHNILLLNPSIRPSARQICHHEFFIGCPLVHPNPLSLQFDRKVEKTSNQFQNYQGGLKGSDLVESSLNQYLSFS